MKFTRSAFARSAAFAMLVAFAAALPQAALAQGNPLAGTWTYKPEKSTFTPGPVRYKSMTLTIPESGDSQMSVEGVDAQNRPVKATYGAVVDGKPHPITGVTAYDSGQWTRNSDTNTSYRYSKGRNIVTLGTRVLSEDGYTLTFREQIYDARGRVATTAMMVFEKPGAELASLTRNQAPANATLQSPLSVEEAAAAAALEKGDMDEAIRLFTQVLQARPTPMRYYDLASRGVAYANKAMYQQAIADFDEAVKVKPDYIDARFRAGGARLQLKQYPAAIEDFSAVIKADDMHAAAYRMRGFTYNVTGQYPLANADNDKACMLNKDLCMQ